VARELRAVAGLSSICDASEGEMGLPVALSMMRPRSMGEAYREASPSPCEFGMTLWDDVSCDGRRRVSWRESMIAEIGRMRSSGFAPRERASDVALRTMSLVILLDHGCSQCGCGWMGVETLACLQRELLKRRELLVPSDGSCGRASVAL